MMYAIATVGDREIPARQWTITHPLAERTLSVRINATDGMIRA